MQLREQLLTPSDLALLETSYITPDLANEAGFSELTQNLVLSWSDAMAQVIMLVWLFPTIGRETSRRASTDYEGITGL